ncbi:tRNA guanosine(34) transglycosylase Tgt [Candidatus Woesearchaeota archaeon]|nr:tRNA guanosine(34) transglycosylase Tgt [Candidatus Woesearchaeota archaeon]
MFRIESEDGNARTGKLKLAHGTIKTPFFMPVATKAVAKFIDSGDFKQSKTQCIISNSLILHLTAGSDAIKKLGGIHKFMNWGKGIFTDSGGFQMYSEQMLIETKAHGVLFKHPKNGKKFFCSPEGSMDIQQKIGSDVAMCLDDMPKFGAKKERILDSMKKTYEWAKRCKAHHEKINRKKQLLFGICQGGLYPELRKKSAEMISSIGFDGLAFGGLALGEPISKMFSAVKVGMGSMPKEKPKYLMGVGFPSQIIEAVSMGVDCFDSTYPTMTARHNYLLTMNGVVEIDKNRYAEDGNPVEKECDCYICRNFSRAYIHHVSKTKEPAGYRLRTLHNLMFMARLMERIRTAIKENELNKLKKELIKIK